MHRAEDPAAHFEAGLTALRAGEVSDYAAARRAFVTAAALSGSATAWYNAGWAAERMGDSAAVEDYRTSTEGWPWPGARRATPRSWSSWR